MGSWQFAGAFRFHILTLISTSTLLLALTSVSGDSSFVGMTYLFDLGLDLNLDLNFELVNL